MFTKDFVFGTGISSYQTEGAVRKGKRVPSIWDTLSHEKGAIRDGSDGDTADDFYDRYPEDIALAKKLGIQSFRLSFSWCRLVNPDQSVNPLGVRFYRSVLSEIVKNGMKPLVTIYHWDLPVYLQMIGGWTNPAIVSYFETYVKIIADHFSDLCSDFLTFNEPQCFLGMGYTGNKHSSAKASITSF
jgi:beta-glucosidase